MSLAARISLGLGLSLATGAAQALTPLPPCDGEEGGMMVYGAEYMGNAASGMALEMYVNKTTAEGSIAAAPGPIPQLDNFNGVRITECRSGQFLAIHGVAPDEAQLGLSATEFLRPSLKAGRRVAMADLRKAAKALYGDDTYVRMMMLRETEETCACRELYPGAWQN